ncbi:glycosyltransferase [Maricaulis sp.]|uniref:glycosyltransferase n=1 Tax=Maricaulis sp. TaxID=1486257 RepID=UPI003A91C260
MARKTEQRSRKARGSSVAKPAPEATPQHAPKPASAPRTIVLVAGMHRSGTSALTGVLNSRGMVIADDLMSSSSDNEKGFFESTTLADIHDKFFTSIGHGYDNARSLPADAFDQRPGEHLRARIVNHIKSFENQEVILIKDPRISRLLPVWKDAAASLNATLKLVIAVRNPLEVAASLDRRNRFSYERSLLLWLRYMVSAERESRDLNRVVVSYPRLLGDWRVQTDRISQSLGLAFPPASKQVGATVDEFLAPELRHHRVDDYSVYEDPRVSDWVRDVYAEFLKAANDEDANLTAVVDSAAGQLAESGDFIEAVIARSDSRNFEAAERERELTTALDNARADLEVRTQAADSKEAELGTLRAELASKEAELDGVRREMRQIERNAVGLDDDSGEAPGPLAAYVAGLRVKVEETAAALERAREEADRYKRSARELEAQLTEARRSSSELAAQLHAVEEDYRLQAARDRQAIGIAEGEVARLNIETERLQGILATATSDQSFADAQAQSVEELQAALDALQAEADDARAAAESASREAESVREKYEEAKAAAAELPILRGRLEQMAVELAAAASNSAHLVADKQEILTRHADLMKQIAALEVEQGRAEDARKELVRLRAERARSKKREYAQDRVLAAREADLATLNAQLEAANARAAKLEVEQQSRIEEVRRGREADLASLKAELETANARTEHLEAERRESAENVRVVNEAAASQRILAERLEGEVATLRAQSEAAQTNFDRLTQEIKARFDGEAARADDASDPVSALSETMDTIERRNHWLEDRFRRGIRPKSALATAITRSGLLGGFVSVFTGLCSPALALRPVRAARLARQAALIRQSGAFDEAYYLEQNWDVRLSNEDPIMHYLLNGAADGRDPSPDFSTLGYLRTHWDVAAAKVNPLVHHLRHGSKERRRAALTKVDLGRLAAARGEDGQLDGLAGGDPYDLRPDDPVLPEAQRGDEFLDRFGLLTEEAQFAAAVTELNSIERKLRVVPDPEFQGVHASIIIPVYGQLAYTLNCLHSLAEHASGLSVEVIVIDDCSLDETPKWLPQVNWIRYVKQENNGGFISSCNLGADQAHGEYLIFLNNDTRVVSSWLDELALTFALKPKAGLVGSKLFYPDGSLQEAGGIFWRDGSAWNYGRNDDPNKPEYCYARRVDYISGASIAVKREVWDAVGGFDGDYYDRAYCEDADLAFKIRQAGQETWYQPLSRAIHYEGKTSGTDLGGGEKAYQVSNQKKFFERWKSELETHAENGVNPLAESDRTRKNAALIIDATTPTPDQDAGSVTVAKILELYSDLDYTPIFVSQDNYLYQRKYTVPLQRVGVFCTYVPYQCSINQVAEQYGANVESVIVFRISVASNVKGAIDRYFPNSPFVFHNIDLHYLRLEREAALSGDLEAVPRIEAVKAKELAMIAAADCAIVHTDAERDVVKRECAAANVEVFTYMVDLEGTGVPFEQRSGVMFLGGYSHAPNVDAVLFFATEVWPLVRDELGDIVFYVVGANPPPEIESLASDEIVVTGRVDELRPYFDASRVFVAPLRYGAGIKGKVATSMSFGLPTVVTTIAAEGMGLTEGQEVLIRDDPKEMAAAIVQLYRDKDVWTQLQDKSFDFVHRNFSTAAGRETLRHILSSASNRRRSR